MWEMVNGVLNILEATQGFKLGRKMVLFSWFDEGNGNEMRNSFSNLFPWAMEIYVDVNGHLVFEFLLKIFFETLKCISLC